MIDLVVPFAPASIWQDREIRYSLRSIEKHLSGYRNIYFVGKLPSFPTQGLGLIAFEDDDYCKEKNIYNKTLRACQERDITDDFLFFNDDHFLLQDCVASEYEFYYKSELRVTSKGLRPGGIYKQAVDNTHRVLMEKGLPTKNFDVHCPIIYNKQFFAENMTKYDWSGKIGYVLKSLYTNTKKIEGERMADCKIGSQHTVEGLKEIMGKRRVFSMGNGAIGPTMMALLEELYPNPSKWEKP